MSNNLTLIKMVGEEWVAKEDAYEDGGDYDFVRDTVGGYLEAIRIRHDIAMWFNEEGKLERLPRNIALIKNNQVVDYIVGNIVVTGVDAEGETVPMNMEQAEFFMSLIKAEVTVGDEKYDGLFLD